MPVTKSEDSATEQASIREQAREYLHKVAAHNDTNYANQYRVLEGEWIDGEAALDMAELALLTQKPIAVAPVVTVAQALDLARRVREIERLLSPPEQRVTGAPKRTAAKGGSGEDPAA